MKGKKNGVVVRIAPSPTGPLHIGTARTALFNYLFAKKHGGKFILRIEDTDKERSKTEYEANIKEGLSWLGLVWDDFYRQSERTGMYKKYLKGLVDAGHAYVSKETAKKEGERAEVIRFRNPNKKVKFNDLVRGEIEFDTTELKDFVIGKSFEEPLYHLAVVVDDHESGVTHVIRGEDHISNTPRQILLGEAIGAARPLYGHIPLILAPDRSKLSKRHGAVALTEFKKEGYLPEAVTNYLALLGWNPGGEAELFSMKELADRFDLGKIQKGGAIFNVEKLNWFNRQYLKKGGEEKIKEFLKSYDTSAVSMKALSGALLERINTLHDIKSFLDKKGEFGFIFNTPEYRKEKLTKGEDEKKTRTRLEAAAKMLRALDAWDAGAVKGELMPYAYKEGRGGVLWPFRYALTGQEKSPDPFTVAEILGKKETLMRLQKAIELLNA